MKTDINIKVRFKTTAEGGRNMPISINKASFYACPLLVDGQAFDCRIFLNEQTLQLGETYVLPVKFLNSDVALSHLSVGKNIVLWEGKEIANGEILSIING